MEEARGEAVAIEDVAAAKLVYSIASGDQ